nr:MAG TPA: ABC transporter, substrate-binding protein transporter [Caudoviricetes sp.]
MMKKLMSLGLVGILSASLMIGCSSSNDSKDDDTVTIKYVDENGNVKQEKVTKERAQQIENNQKQQTNDTTKNNNATKKETTKDNSNKDDQDDMTEDEMYEKGLIKKHGGHLEEEAKEQERKHQAEDEANEGKYPIRYDADGTQINDENGNLTPEFEQKRDNSGDGDYNYWDHHDHVITQEELDEQGVHYNDYEKEESIENDNDVEESPSETIENN